MGWVWKGDDVDPSPAGDITKYDGSGGDGCSTRRIVSSQCRTEETEPGKFIRKCERTEQIFRDCLGRPSELVQSNKEYTEEDVTNQVTKGSSFPMEAPANAPFDFPGLRNDIDAIERNFFSGVNRFFEAAEDMTNGFFNAFGVPRTYDGGSPAATRGRNVPFKDYSYKEASPKLKSSNQEALPKHKKSDGDLDLSGLARDV